MACNAGPDIIEDGLVFCVDAANINSYPKSGTTWSDLVGSNHGTMQNMTSANYSSDNGGSLIFDGTDEYIQLGSNLPEFTPASRSASIWFKVDTIGSSMMLITNDSNTNHGYGFDIYVRPEGYLRSRNYNSAYDLTSTYAISANTWVNFTMTYDGTYQSSYFNGDFHASALDPSNSTSSTNYRIGRWTPPSSPGIPLDGNVSQVLLYNRALTADEIRRNYEATVGRFT